MLATKFNQYEFYEILLLKLPKLDKVLHNYIIIILH